MHDHDHGEACCTSCAQGNPCEGECRQENPPGCARGICAMPNPVAGTFVSEEDQEKARAMTTAYQKGYAEGEASVAPGVNPVLAAVGGLLVGALIVRMAWGSR